MSIKISELPASSGAVRTMQFEVNNGGTSERLTLAQMFALSTGAVTTDTPLLNMAQTWNAGGVTFTGWKLNVTDTASAAGSLLLDLRVGGASVFTVSKAGALSIGEPLLYDPSGNPFCRFGAGRFTLPVELGFGTVGAVSAPDLVLVREAANTLAQRNGANAQEFRLYNTYTDASNYERGFLRWSSNVLRLGAEALGTGSDRELYLTSGANIRLFSTGGASVIVRDAGNTANYFEVSASALNVSRHLLFPSDNTYDIGASGATRPANIYAAGKIKGQIQTHAAAVSETITPDKTLTLYDNSGTAYKVPCVAA